MPGYGAPAWQEPTQTESKAIVALVCAIAAWAVVPFCRRIAALMIGKTARQEILRSRRTAHRRRSLVTAGRSIAWVNIVLCVLGVVLLVLGVLLFAVAGSAVSVCRSPSACSGRAQRAVRLGQPRQLPRGVQAARVRQQPDRRPPTRRSCGPTAARRSPVAIR